MPDAEGPACPTCKRPRDAKLRCWWCHDRACIGCGLSTGSAFIALCIGCGRFAGDDGVRALVLPDAPHDEPAPPKRWILVLEAESGPVPMSCRVKQVVKYAKRRHGLHVADLPNHLPDDARQDLARDVRELIEDERRERGTAEEEE